LKSILVVALWAPLLAAQAPDDTWLKQVIIFGRHSVRSPLAPNSTLNQYSTQEYPQFNAPPGYLTNNGAALETRLGAYYRAWLTQEGLLTGIDSADAGAVYLRANNLERTIASAQAFASGLLPSAAVTVDFVPAGIDPLFDPVSAGVARFDYQEAAAAVAGRLGGDPQSLSDAYAAEFALARSVLFGYPAGQTPAPAAPAGKMDVTAIPIHAAPGVPGLPVDLGGLLALENAVTPFLLEYADGMQTSDVAWGRLTSDQISQLSRITALTLDLESRTPYTARAESSNLLSHMVRSMVQAADRTAMAGSLASPQTKAVILIASDINITALAALLHLDWILPGYQENFCALGGALVFELRQSQHTGEYIVRASYVAQTLDQLRDRTVLSLNAPPSIAPIFIPGCSGALGKFDCSLAGFVRVTDAAIDRKSVDLIH
jgi:4-phytase/acid phosphatase